MEVDGTRLRCAEEKAVYKFRYWLFITQIVMALIFIICINPGIFFTLNRPTEMIMTQPTEIGATKSYAQLIDEGISDKTGANKRDTHSKIDLKRLEWMFPFAWTTTPILFILLPSLAILFISWEGILQGISRNKVVDLWLYLRSLAWFLFASYVMVLVIGGYVGEIITELDTSSDLDYYLYHFFLYFPFVNYLALLYQVQVETVNDFLSFVLLPCFDIGDASYLVSIMSLNSWKIVRAESARTDHQWPNYDWAIIFFSAAYLLSIPTFALIIQSRTTLKKKDTTTGVESEGSDEENTHHLTRQPIDNTSGRIGRYPHLIVCLVLNVATLIFRIFLMTSHSNADYSFIKNVFVIVMVFALYCPCCGRIDDRFTMVINGPSAVVKPNAAPAQALLRGSINTENGYENGARSSGRNSNGIAGSSTERASYGDNEL